jgi:hypothetical protein
MTSDPDRTQRPPTPDDDQLGALVRAAADDWRMPPQRLDQPTWRDRVGVHGTRRRRGWFARLAGPATAAVVVTVVVAFAAVWLTAPRSDRGVSVGSSPSPDGAGPSASTPGRPTPSPLPVLFRNGALPQPARVMVRADGAYQVADLTTGSLGVPSIATHTGPTTVLPRPGGGWLCICGDSTGSSVGRPTGIDLTLDPVAAGGSGGSGTVIRSLHGVEVPNVPAASQLELADARASVSMDGRYAFVGWSARAGAAGWTAGIDVIDLTTATVVGAVPITVSAEPAGAGQRPTTRVAPRVDLAPAGDTVLVSSFWYVDDPSPTPPSGTDHWTASFDGGAIGSLQPAGATSGTSCGEFDGGLIDATTYYVLCGTPDGRLMVGRDGVDGHTIDQTEVPRMGSGIDGGALVARQGDHLFLWDPVATRLTRFDLRSAAVDNATGTAAAMPSGSALDALADLGRRLGRWMAPSTLAKVFLEPALVVSADGTRIYALGIDSIGGDLSSGSRGIYAFDVTTLAPAGHWAPTADFISLAISADGRFVYAAGSAGVDATGAVAPNGASVTVYDTTDGSVRLIAGSLGSGEVSFPGPTVR